MFSLSWCYSRYLQSIDKAYRQHYKRRHEEREAQEEEGERETEVEEGEEGVEDESYDEMEADDEEEELDPDEELHISDTEENDQDFDSWFERYFPEMPREIEHAPQRGTRRRSTI